MRYRALATDYDGTLATHGTVDQDTIASLERFIASGRKLIMVTGRELPDLKRVFPRLDLFSRVVAENGAVLLYPSPLKPKAGLNGPQSATSGLNDTVTPLKPESGLNGAPNGAPSEALLCDPVPGAFADELRRQGMPVSVGRVIVATVEPHQEAVRKTIADLGLSLAVSLNKGSIMVLPAGISKVTGFRRALLELGLREEAVVGIGDAENDLDFLAVCGCGVAVANATPQVKSRADLVTYGAHGSGVTEVINQLLATDQLACDHSRRQLLVPE